MVALQSDDREAKPQLMSATHRVAALLILGVVACGGSNAPKGPIEPTYENVEAVVMRACASSSSCHGGTSSGKARLNLALAIEETGDLRTALVDVDACQYDFLKRVNPGHPELSWIMQKLDGDYDSDTGLLNFTPDPSWDPGIERGEDGKYPSSRCPTTKDGELYFGLVMPYHKNAPDPLEAREVEMFREWIAAGAPGPTSGADH